MIWTIRHRETTRRGLVQREFGEYPSREAAAAWIAANVTSGQAKYEPVEVGR